MRQLTMKFGTYRLSKWEKSHSTSVMNLFDVGDFEINRIAEIIRLGNPETDDEADAYNRLDAYLQADESNSLITAFFDLMDEFNRDTKLFNTVGVSVSAMKQRFLDRARRKAAKRDADNFFDESESADEGETEDENKPALSVVK